MFFGTCRTQLRQTVKGLSVAAITYYVASLAYLLFEGAHSSGLHVGPNVATAFTVPFALVRVAWLVRRIRRELPDPCAVWRFRK